MGAGGTGWHGVKGRDMQGAFLSIEPAQGGKALEWASTKLVYRVDDLGWSLMFFRNHVFFLMILQDFVTWRRVLCTPSLFEREGPSAAFFA